MKARFSSKERKREKIISVLLETGGRIKEAAAMLEMGEVTIWRYLQDREFLAAYREARSRLLELTIGKIFLLTEEALKTLRGIIQDSRENAGPRVSAARVILDLAIKGQEIENLRARIEALEERLSK